MRVRTLLMIRTRQFPALNCSTPAARVSYALTAFSITVFGNRFKYSGARSAKLPRIKCLDVAILQLQKLFICRGDRQTFAHAAVAIHTAGGVVVCVPKKKLSGVKKINI